MLFSDNIKVDFECQGYKATHFGKSPDMTASVLFFEIKVKTKDVTCPSCNSKVYVHDNYQTYLTDVPFECGMILIFSLTAT